MFQVSLWVFKKKMKTGCHINIKGVDFLICCTNLTTNLVTVKNLETGNKKDIDYYKLQKLIDDEAERLSTRTD